MCRSFSLITVGALFALTFSFSFCFGLSASPFNLQQLTAVDELRLQSRGEFSTALHKLLQNKEQQYSDYEKRYLDLLIAYDLVFNGNLEDALLVVRDIVGSNQSKDDDVITLRARSLEVNIDFISFRYLDAFEKSEALLMALPNVQDEMLQYQLIGPVALLYSKIERFDIVNKLVDDALGNVSNELLRCRLTIFKLTGIYKQKNFDAYEDKFKQVTEICSAAKETTFYYLALRDRMFYLLERNKADEVIEIYQKYHSAILETKYPILISGFNAATSEAYSQLGNDNEAFKLANDALAMISQNRNDPAVLSAYRALYKSAKNAGRLKDALLYAEKLRDIESAIMNDNRAQQIAFHISRGEILIKNQRIALLDKDNELLSLQKDLYEQELKQNRLITIVLLSVLVLASFLAYRGMSGRKRFKKIAEYDQLTGISNRYHFNNQAKVALEYCEKNAKPVAVILFDLDYFKNINDLHGHAAGDWALQQVVKTCRNFMRNNDVFGRIGGEEFAVVLPGCQTDKAVLLAEICRDAIAGIDSTDCGKQFPLSASFGVCGSDTSGYQLKQLLADADNAMYSAKEAGRDQVMAFSA